MTRHNFNLWYIESGYGDSYSCRARPSMDVSMLLCTSRLITRLVGLPDSETRVLKLITHHLSELGR